MDERLIAPCGMNCRLCSAYQRKRKPCPGCNSEAMPGQAHLTSCKIRNCEALQAGQSGFCPSGCGSFPCRRLKQLDARYREKYQSSMLENLAYIEKNGMDSFLQKQKERWTCQTCGGILCMHTGTCLHCQPREKRNP